MALLIHRKVAGSGGLDGEPKGISEWMNEYEYSRREKSVEGTYGKWKESGKLQLLHEK